MDHLLQSRQARVITVASIVHEVKCFDWDFIREQKGDMSSADRYYLSKLANILFAKELAKRCRGMSMFESQIKSTLLS